MSEIRLMEEADYHIGFMELINTFTRSPKHISYEEFCEAYAEIKKQNGVIFVAVKDNTLIGTIKLLVEKKLHNNLQSVGHIEDLTTHPEFRNMGTASQLIQIATDYCKGMGCYKIVLACNKEYTDFYVKRGFLIKGTELSLYIS